MRGLASKPASAEQSNSPFRSYGSRKTAVQAKLQVNKPGDAHEMEADQAAEKVVNQPKDTDVIARKPISHSITPLQRKEEDTQLKEEDTVQAKEDVQQKEELQKKESPQFKNDISWNNTHQKKEDSVQRREDVQMKESEIAQMGMPSSAGEKDPIRAAFQRKEDVQMKEAEIAPMGMPSSAGEKDPIRAAVQRKEEVQAKEEESVQAKESKTQPAGPVASESIDQKLSSSKGTGTPLSADVQSEMESGFGADFSSVQVHTGSQAQSMSKEIGAQAFTHKNDIYFNQGKYDPNSTEGKKLLAHELTHTIQQGAASPKASQNLNPQNKEITATEVATAKTLSKENPEKQQSTEKQVTELDDKVKDQSPAASAPNNPINDEQLSEKQPVAQDNSINAVKEQEAKSQNIETTEEKESGDDKTAEQPSVEAMDEAVTKELTQKAQASEPKENQNAAPTDKPSVENVNSEKGGDGGASVNFKNPPPVKDAKTEEATDKVGEGVGIDEKANVNVEGLIMTAQQFRDQGKESILRAKTQTEYRLTAEKKLNVINTKLKGSDDALQKAEKNTNFREQQLLKIMVPALFTSAKRKEKVSSEVGSFKAVYNQNWGNAKKLKNKSAGLSEGSKKNNNPDEKESGELSSNLGTLDSGSATLAGGIAGGGSITKKLAVDAKKADTKNSKTEKDLLDSKAKIHKSQIKINSEKNRNHIAKSAIKSLATKFQASKKQEEQLTANGKGLISTSFEIEKETHSAQNTYYKDMKTVEGSDQMIVQEEMQAQAELSNGPDGLLFSYASLKSEADKEAFLASLSPDERINLGKQLHTFELNFESWVESKKEELGERVEKKRSNEINHHNSKRNKGLELPLNKATKNIDKISKSGLLWTSMTKSLQSMWEGFKNIGWADVSKIGMAMINPMETYRTIAEAVGGIYTDMSDWKGFSENPVGMLLQKGSSIGIKLTTIAGVVTGLLVVLTALTSAAAVFIPPLWAVAGWLAGASLTMGTITGYLGGVTAAVSFLGGIKNIYNVHTAKTAEEVYQGNNNLKKDAANTATGVLAMVGAKSLPKPLNFAKIGNFKNTAIRTFKTGASLIKGGVRKIPRLASSAFRKETWTNLSKSFRNFSLKESEDILGGSKKSIAKNADNVAVKTPKKALKNVEEPNVSSKHSKGDNILPEKQKTIDVENPSKKKVEIKNEVPEKKKLSEAKASEPKSIEIEHPEGNIKKIDDELDKPHIEKEIIELKGGKKGEGWNKELNKELKPNSKYKVDDYLYETDSEGRIMKVSGQLQLDERGRNNYQQGKSVTSKGGTKGEDQGGHLIGDRFNGPGEQINYLPMDAKLNQGAWKKMENDWAKAIKEGKNVEVDIRPIFEGTSKRPIEFEVFYKINGEEFVKYFNN